MVQKKKKIKKSKNIKILQKAYRTEVTIFLIYRIQRILYTIQWYVTNRLPTHTNTNTTNLLFTGFPRRRCCSVHFYLQYKAIESALLQSKDIGIAKYSTVSPTNNQRLVNIKLHNDN